MDQFEQYWTIEQVAERLHSAAPSVRRWIGQGVLAKTKAGGRTLISETALQEFLKRSTEKSAKAASTPKGRH